MKSAKGISVIALVITVIVIVIVTSITTYTGINMISDARKKDATDKLKVICNALRKDDTFLNFDSGETILTEQDYIELDLKNYFDEDYPVYLIKNTTYREDELEKKYTLKMYKGIGTTEIYVDEEFSITKSTERKIYDVSFDEKKGVNRPIITSRMYALTNDGTGLVKDVYEEDWYNYNSEVPSFAKMKYDSDGDGNIDDEDETYVWIPRFAYSIQSFYNGSKYPKDKIYKNVQSTAMKIVFLREDTNYMINDEVVPAGYFVHPAFINGNTKLSGIWIKTETSEDSVSLEDAVSYASYATGGDAEASSHLMTNSEYSAALYLMFSMNKFDEINFTLQNEFVAGGLISSTIINNLEYSDKYELDSISTTGITIKRGDALLETNWNRLTANYPTTSAPCIVRLLKSGYFDFTSVPEEGSNYHYRNVIVSK